MPPIICHLFLYHSLDLLVNITAEGPPFEGARGSTASQDATVGRSHMDSEEDEVVIFMIDG